MKKVDLKIKLKEMGVPENWYHLEEDGNNDQRLCISKENNKWLVYYSERGSKLVTTEFWDEGEACEEFMSRIMKMLDNTKKRQRA